MAIFPDLPVNSEPGTIKAAVMSVAQRVAALRQSSATCSLGELGTDEKDFDWLSEWASQLKPSTSQNYLHPEDPINGDGDYMRHRFAIGSLLLLFAAESARRALPVESEWLLPTKMVFPEATRNLLFINGAPSPAYLSALREAGRRLGLRETCCNCAAGFISGDQSALNQPKPFNDFLMAQIGLMDVHIEGLLHDWLSNDRYPSAIRALLDEQRGSKSFRKTWETMKAYRQRIIDEQWLREALDESPWILPIWVDRIINAIPIGDANPRPTAPRPNFIPPTSQRDITAEIQIASEQDIFGDFSPFGGVKTVIKAVRTVVARMDQLGLGEAPWSLAELRLSEYDYCWLKVWVKRLEPFTVHYCQDKNRHFNAGNQRLSFPSGLGALLLIWLSETARRNAVEGELWPHVVAEHFTPEINEMLFSQGHSSMLLRELLEAAVRKLNLRHMLDEQGVQRWMDTVFLQFGFTERGFRQQLPEWLARHATTRAVSTLLDQQTGSAGFQLMWEDLRAYRRKQITEWRLRTTLKDSPWILPEWINVLIALSDASTGKGADETMEQPPSDSFLTAPVLHWPPNADPYFLCQIASEFSDLNLTESCYDVLIGGTVRAQLLRQADGGYLPVPSRVITISFDTPSTPASLVNERGQTVKEMDLELWPAGEDVVIYRFPPGERLPDAFTATLNNNASYGLLLSSDLEITPQPAEWRFSQGVTFYRLPSGWAHEIEVRLDGELLWKPSIRQTSKIPNWANDLGIFLADNQSVKWGKEFRIKIIHRPSVRVRYARCQGCATDVAPVNPTSTYIGPLVVATDLNTRGLNFHIGLENGDQRCSIRRKLDLNFMGAAHLNNGAWQVLNKHSELTVEQAKRDIFRIELPPQWGGVALNANELAMIEGEDISHRRPSANGALGSLTGWGAPLKIRPLFNAAPGSLSLTLAGSVVDHGILNDAVCESLQDGQARLLRLRFRRLVEPDKNHNVIWWDVNGQARHLSPKYWDEAEGVWWWVCELPEDCAKPLAIAIAYKGERQGSWWEDWRWLQPLSNLVEQNARRVAALLRWFHLPLLSADAVAVLRPLVEKHQVDFLRAWLMNEGLPDDLEYPPKDEAWLSVVRALFSDWRPDTEQARQTLMALAEVETEKALREYLPDAARRLYSVDPLLMAKVLRKWQDPQKPGLVQNLRAQFAGLDHAGNLNQLQQHLLNQVSANLKLNSAFINNGILNRAVQILNGVGINQTDVKNLAVAARIEDLRRLLALRLLEQV